MLLDRGTQPAATHWWDLPSTIILCELVGILGALLGRGGFSTWYRGLKKPSFAPPSGVFGPVWTALYAMMGLALYLVRRSPDTPARRNAQRLFGVQLTLNGAWTPLFFGLRSPLMGLMDIVPLLGAVLLTVRAFLRLSRPAGFLLVPYLLWVGFATVLNGAFWWQNRAGQQTEAP